MSQAGNTTKKKITSTELELCSESLLEEGLAIKPAAMELSTKLW